MRCCPFHPGGGCGLRSHGTYERLEPPGTKISRWYCRKAQATVSLLPDCLAARFPGTLPTLEEVVAVVEQARTVEAAAEGLHPEVELPGSLRWVRRRLGVVYAGLLAVRTLMPELFGECAPRVFAFREHLGVVPVLPLLRALASEHLHTLPPPLGFGPRQRVDLRLIRRLQQSAGPRAPPRRP